MTNISQTFKAQFFSSIGDASQIVRLFDFLPNVFLYLKDSHGRFAAMNDSLVQMRGAKHERQLLGKTDLEIHPVFWGRKYQLEDRKVMESGHEIQNQVWLVPDGNGKLASFVSSKVPLRSHEGGIIGIAGVMYPLVHLATESVNPDPIQIATEFINHHYSEPIEIQQVAQHAALSTSQLNRRFRSTYQLSPSQYLQRVRVHNASRALLDTDKQIGIIALDNGFYDQAHLTRLFRRWMGVTPFEFRKDSRKQS